MLILECLWPSLHVVIGYAKRHYELRLLAFKIHGTTNCQYWTILAVRERLRNCINCIEWPSKSTPYSHFFQNIPKHKVLLRFCNQISFLNPCDLLINLIVILRVQSDIYLVFPIWFCWIKSNPKSLATMKLYMDLDYVPIIHIWLRNCEISKHL